MRHLINITDLSTQEIDELIAVAEDIIAQPEKYQEVCRHKKLATLFFEPSTRTRLSFESAMLSLGGSVLGFSEANSSSASKGETVGDTVRVFVKVVEGSRERLQNFEGVVIKMQGGGVRKTFTVRRVSYGVGVERTFPYNSPRIGRIEVVRHGKVRRAKLYYLRDRVGKAAKVVERISADKEK